MDEYDLSGVWLTTGDYFTVDTSQIDNRNYSDNNRVTMTQNEVGASNALIAQNKNDYSLTYSGLYFGQKIAQILQDTPKVIGTAYNGAGSAISSVLNVGKSAGKVIAAGAVLVGSYYLLQMYSKTKRALK